MDVPIQCIMCKRHSGKGISILGRFICCECEKTLVNTDINSGQYEEYKEFIKKNILGDILLKQRGK